MKYQFNFRELQLAEMYIGLMLEGGYHSVQVVDYEVFKQYRSNGVRQLRKVDRFNGNRILVSGYDELGNRGVLTTSGHFYNYDEELV
jgi:hypothetical protein